MNKFAKYISKKQSNFLKFLEPRDHNEFISKMTEDDKNYFIKTKCIKYVRWLKIMNSMILTKTYIILRNEYFNESSSFYLKDVNFWRLSSNLIYLTYFNSDFSNIKFISIGNTQIYMAYQYKNYSDMRIIDNCVAANKIRSNKSCNNKFTNIIGKLKFREIKHGFLIKFVYYLIIVMSYLFPFQIIERFIGYGISKVSNSINGLILTLNPDLN